MSGTFLRGPDVEWSDGDFIPGDSTPVPGLNFGIPIQKLPDLSLESGIYAINGLPIRLIPLFRSHFWESIDG